AGLFVGTFFLGFLADRFGRLPIFTYALLGYTAASVIMACQTSSAGLLFWRFLAGIGIGIEVITIDAYITELVPSRMRGRAFATRRSCSSPCPSSPSSPGGWCRSRLMASKAGAGWC
ncbi:MFS transporter, partial [Acinetobacter baumannii]|uniref:MFS transporter n=1 Tax=Acinetobacter baumannii TaxID=470 RepID=UPI001D179EAD